MELVILLVSNCFLLFELLDVEANFQSGYVTIVIMGSYIVTSLFSIIVGIIVALKLKVRICCVNEALVSQVTKFSEETARDEPYIEARSHGRTQARECVKRLRV